MKKNTKENKYTVTKSSRELAEALGLTPAEGLEIEIRSSLNDKIIEVVQKKGLTHLQVAKLAKTSRTRVTALMNRNKKEISTDLMIRILSAIGVRAKIFYKEVA